MTITATRDDGTTLTLTASTLVEHGSFISVECGDVTEFSYHVRLRPVAYQAALEMSPDWKVSA